MSVLRKKSTTTDNSRLVRFAWFRFFVGLSVFMIALSFFTPYPLQILHAFGLGSDQTELPAHDEAKPGDAETDPGTTEPDSPKDREEEEDVEPPPPDSVLPPPPGSVTPPPSSEPGDLTQFTPLRLPRPTTATTLVMPPLPPIIPDGPGTDAVWDINELARGLNFKSEINFKKSSDSATLLRNDRGNYRVTLKMDITLPEPLKNASDLAGVNPSLPRIFPNLEQLTQKAKVSGFYHQLMARKQLEMRKDLVTLDRLLTRHNYYDCETILEITAPASQRKALWIQADMDVVSDGTDGDRLPHMPAEIVNSAHYQPFTSYRWPKQTDTPNPMLAAWQKRLKDAKSRTATLQQKKSIPTLERGITDLRANSFLIAEYDPFIVIPLGIMNNSSSAFSPSPGDYAVVVHKNKLYPAIVGDAGPRYKIGEASLRLAREVNAHSSPYRRPVSDLTVSYIVFPKSADPVRQAPDYAVWKQKCAGLLEDLGGIAPGYELHDWENLLAPKTPKLPNTDEPGTRIDPLTGKKLPANDQTGDSAPASPSAVDRAKNIQNKPLPIRNAPSSAQPRNSQTNQTRTGAAVPASGRAPRSDTKR